MKIINLLLVDDSEIHLEGLKTIFRPYEELHVLGEAYSPSEVKAFLRQQKPDVILLDISMEEEMDGIDLARYLYQSHPEIVVMILSHYKEVHFIIEALRAYVRAYIAKDSKSANLVNAIFSVMGGDGVFLGETLPYKALLKAFGNEDELNNGKPQGLNDLEIEIIKKLASGMSSKEIGNELQITTNTVETHKERIKAKLGYNTVVEIVVFCYRLGIIK